MEKFLAVIISFLFVNAANAGWLDAVYLDGELIERLTVTEQEIYFTGEFNTGDIPVKCKPLNSNRWAMLLPGNRRFDKMYSMLETAISNKIPVRVFVSDCYSKWGGTYPIVRSVRLVESPVN